MLVPQICIYILYTEIFEIYIKPCTNTSKCETRQILSNKLLMQTFRFLNKAISGSVFYNRNHKLNHHDGDSCLLCFQILLYHCIEVVNKVLTKCFILQRYQLYDQCNLGIVFMIITTSQSNIAVIQCLECMLLML